MTNHESPADTRPEDAPVAPTGGAQDETPGPQGEGPIQDAASTAPDPEKPTAEGNGAAPDPKAQAEPDGADQDEASGDEAAGEAPDGEEAPSDAAGGGAPPPPEPPREDPRLRLLQAEVAKKDELLRDYIRAHKKAQAEWDAYRARLQRDEAAHVEAARGKAVEVLLDVGDDMERSLAAARQGGSVESLLEGLELVHRRFFRALEELGLETHDPTGEPFNPETMEAIGVVPVTDPDQDGKVVHTLRIGYRLGKRELRPAVVQVGRKG